MVRVAFTTFAIMKGPYGDPQVEGFEILTPPVFNASENAEGFIARAHEIDSNDHLSNFERDWGEWGLFAVPRFYDGGFETATDTRASTLSLWQSLEAVHHFVYTGLHRHALDQRKKWFRKPQWPSYAIWWVDDTHVPTWSEACKRLELLHDNGSTPDAFNFHKMFDSEGRETVRSHAKIT